MTSNNNADPARIALLVDRFLAHENARAAKRAPSPAKPTSVTTDPTTPVRKTPTPKPSSVPKTEPQQGEKKAMPIRKPKIAAKRKTPRKPKPPKGYSVEIPAEAMEPSKNWTQPGYTVDKPKASARDVTEATPCRICGGAVEHVEGTYTGRWRQHRECANLSARSAFRVAPAVAHLGLGIEISSDLAAAVDMFIPTYEGTGAQPVYGADHVDRLPWHHVDRKALVRALLLAKGALTEAATPKACEQGRCCWCGRAEALDWRLWGHRWPDGSPAPMCEECSTTYVRRGHPSPSYPDDARLVVVEAITGVRPSMGDTAPAALRAFHEVGNGGVGEAWDYLPSEAVEALRWALWGRFNGKHAPVEHRAEAVARHRAREADRAAKLTAIEQADPFGFGGVADPIKGEVDLDA